MALQYRSPEPSAFVSLDCEFVGVGIGGYEHALARVSLVGWQGDVEYDSYVAVEQPVADYRTWCSGITAAHLVGAPSFASVQADVARLIHGRVLVGHALHNDLQVLRLHHPPQLIRDTQAFTPLQILTSSSVPSLRNIARCLFDDCRFQMEEHSSVEDALMTMRVYLCYAEEWETWLGSPFVGLWSSVFPAPVMQQARRAKYGGRGRRGGRRQKQQQQQQIIEVLPPTPPASPMREVPSALESTSCTVESWPPTPPATPPHTAVELSFDAIMSSCDLSTAETEVKQERKPADRKRRYFRKQKVSTASTVITFAV